MYSGWRHWDGTAVSFVRTPDDQHAIVGGTSAGDVFAVDVRDVFHFDGAAWTPVPLGPAAPASPAASTDVYAVAPGVALALASDGALVASARDGEEAAALPRNPDFVPPASLAGVREHVWSVSGDDFLVVGAAAAFHYGRGAGTA